MTKLLFAFTLILFFQTILISQCYTVDIEYGDEYIIAHCQIKLVTITITNNSCGDEHFDVYVTSDDNTAPVIVNLGDFTNVGGPGIKIAANNVFIEASGHVELFFTFNAPTTTSDFNLEFLSKIHSETLYNYDGLRQFFVQRYKLLTGSLAALLATQGTDLFSQSESCNPSRASSYVVRGVFTVDVDYCLRGTVDGSNNPNANIIIEPGASIVVSSSSFLEVVNMIVATRNNTACESQTGWPGFNVQNGSRLSVINSQIKDAHYGIDADPGSTVSCTRTSFIDNYIGIYSGWGVGATVNVTLSQCKFFPNEGFANAYTGQPTRIGTEPFAGIEAFNSNLIVTGGGTQNIIFTNFQNLRHGIRALDCNLTVQRCTLREIGLENNSSGFNNSSNGIRMRGIKTKTASITNCNFYEMQHCIRSLRMNATIDGCHFGDLQPNNYDHIVGYGIIVESSNTPHIIQNCTLRVNQTGILLYQNLFGSASNFIRNNRFITDQWDDSKGIWGDVTTTSWEIHNNFFVPVKGLNGVRTNNCARFNIHDNDIKYPSSLNLSHHAIKLISDDQMNVQCNTVYNGPTNSGLNLHAFDVSLTPNSNFICNSSTTGERQMVFLENNMNSLIKGNTLAGGALYGLCVGDDQIKDAIIGEQPSVSSGHPDHGNRWTGSYNTYGAANFSSNALIMELSRFLVDHWENSQFLPSLPGGQSGPFFLDQAKEAASFSCASLSSCAALHPRERYIGNADTPYISIIDESLNFEFYEDEQRWTSKYLLYKLLRQGDFIAEAESEFEAFLDDNVSTELGKLYNAEATVKNAISLKQNQWDTIGIGISELNEYQVQLDTLIANWEEADSTIKDSLYDQMLIAISEMDTISSPLNIIYDTLAYHLATRADAMSSVLEELTTSSTPAENLRLALIFMLKKVADPLYEFDTTELEDIQTIAEICELEGGIGTNLAQAILGGELQQSFERYENCEFSSPLILNKNNSGINAIRISPVPSYDNILMECLNVSEKDQHYKIVDIFGKDLNNFVLSANSIATTINIDFLTYGAYYIVNIDNSTEHAKFIKH
ncbi:MAG: hypothetical protein IPO78_01880 [Saprospiraceae bacterium]|nr:hypothetical protein [Saprospiraceae bacterium]